MLYKHTCAHLILYGFPQEDFFFVMQNLPVHVPDDDIAEMFAFADKDGDGQLSYEEFEVDEKQPETIILSR